MNLPVVNFQRCERVFHHRQAWVKLQLALCLLLLTILQLYHLPPPLPPPGSSSSCLFTRCQPLDASCCTVLLYYSRYCTVRLKTFSLGFPGGPVVGNLPASAGDTGSSPGPGRSHMSWSNCVPQLPRAALHNCWACALEPVSHNYWARTPQLGRPVCLEPVLRNRRGHRNERPVHCNDEWTPLTATRESPRAATETQRSKK